MIKSLILKILKNRLDKGEPLEEVLDSYLLKISSYKEEIIKELYDYMKYEEPYTTPISIQDQAVTNTTTSTTPINNTLGNEQERNNSPTNNSNNNSMTNSEKRITFRLNSETFNLLLESKKNIPRIRNYSISRIIREAIKEYYTQQSKGGSDNSLLPKQ